MAKLTKTKFPDELQKLRGEIKTADENWKRALADYQNLVKRIETEKREFVKFASANLIAKFLPSLDILELAAKHSQDQGVVMAVKQFRQVLVGEGLQEIVPQIGENFDHTVHECVETIAGNEANTIAEVITKGYKIDDYIIRPAKVKVYSLTN